MNEQDSDGLTSDSAEMVDGPTSEQSAVLRYLGIPFDDNLTRAQATALIAAAEDNPVGRTRLQAWHRDKYSLHPGLFAPPQRSFREARWWQSRVTDDHLHGYSFRQPSLNQTLVILESLDAREPGWERESKSRRETRFMNELATLSPELCKPDCSYPQELPEDDPSAPVEPAVPTPLSAPRAPSAPFVPGSMGATAPKPPSLPAWTPAAPLPPDRPTKTIELADHAPARRRGGGLTWLLWIALLAMVGVVAAVGYIWSHRSGPELSVRSDPTPSAAAASSTPKPAAAYAPVPAKESRQRAIAKHPDLAQPGSPLNAKFVAAYHILESQHSPRLLQPDWPEQLADEFSGSPATAPTPSPAAMRGTLPPTPPIVPSAPLVTSAAVPVNAAAATPSPTTSARSLFVALQAEYKSKVNTVKYHQHGESQHAAVAVNVRSMMQSGARFTVRCVFFKRPTGRGDLRNVLSKADKHFELAAGGTYDESFDSPEVYRGRGATEEFDGWLVQLFPEGSDQFVKQIGSTGTIEELGRRMNF